MGSRWTLEDLQKKSLKFRSIVVDHTGPLPVNRIVVVEDTDKPKKYSQNPVKNIPREEPAPLKAMKQILKFMQVPFVTEHKFLEDRKFRFDIALPEIKLAVEYEGLWSNKSRHTTEVGYSRDTEKYNLAVIDGWRVLRYTSLTYKQFLNDLDKLNIYGKKKLSP